MKLTTTLIAIFLIGILCAQPGSNDPTFNIADNGSAGTGYGIDATVYATAIQSDGKIIAGGQFVTYNGTMKRRIVRLNPDGTLDPSFSQGTGLSGFAHAICIQDDGKIIVGGVFTSYDGTPSARIIRFNANGSVDGTFTTGTGFNGAVYAIEMQSDGKIIVGGSFSSYNGFTTTNIARLNSDGTFDNSFVSGSGFDNLIRTIEVQQDDKIIAGGDFTSYNGGTNNYLLRLNTDGTTDATFLTGSGLDGAVRTLSLQADGKVVIGGAFTSYNSLANNRIIRINSDGSIDNTFIIGNGFNEPVLSSTIQTDGKIIVGGEFTTYNGANHVRLIRLNNDGTDDATFQTGSGYDHYVESISVAASGKIIAGGHFTYVNDVNKNYLVLLNSDGTIDHAFNQTTGLNAIARTTTIQPDGKIIVGGEFAYANGASRKYISRLNSDGSIDASFQPGEAFNNVVWATSLQFDGKIIAVGTFTTFNGSTCNRIARINTDGTLDATFNPGTAFNNMTASLAIQPDGKILVGGNFTTFNGNTQRRIVRLNSDGTIDSSFDPGLGFNDVVRSIIVQPDGKILVGGNFTTFNGVTHNYVVRLNSDGTHDGTFDTGTGFDDLVWTLALQSDGKIIAGGWFSNYNGSNAGKICRLNSDGTIDASFNSGTGFNNVIYSILPQSDGKINVAGQFSNFITQLNSDGTTNSFFDVGTGADASIFSLSIQADGKLIAAGDFLNYDQTPRTRIARIENCVSTSTIDTQVHCSAYTWINGVEYTTSNNTAIHTISNGFGCDSTIYLHLTINEPTHTTIVHSACESYTWPLNSQTYTASGTYTHVIPTTNNCDSTVTLNLTINDVDETVSVNGNTLSANQTGATYQWIDCDGNTPISGATTNTFTATTVPTDYNGQQSSSRKNHD